MSYAIPADEPGGAAPAALSLLVHGVLFALLVFSLHWQSKHPDPVVAELWTELPAFEPPAPKVEPKPEAKQPKPEPKIEQKASKPDIALEREKKKKKEEPPLKFDMTQRMREQLAQEQQALSRNREKQEAVKQFASPAPVGDPRYIEKIRARIWSKVTLPSDIKGNPEVVFEVIQLPTGDVLSAKLVKSSGHKLYDEAVERAILNSSPLPKPDRLDQFMRELTLKFRPRD